MNTKEYMSQIINEMGRPPCFIIENPPEGRFGSHETTLLSSAKAYWKESSTTKKVAIVVAAAFVVLAAVALIVGTKGAIIPVALVICKIVIPTYAVKAAVGGVGLLAVAYHGVKCVQKYRKPLVDEKEFNQNYLVRIKDK